MTDNPVSLLIQPVGKSKRPLRGFPPQSIACRTTVRGDVTKFYSDDEVVWAAVGKKREVWGVRISIPGLASTTVRVGPYLISGDEQLVLHWDGPVLDIAP